MKKRLSVRALKGAEMVEGEDEQVGTVSEKEMSEHN